jgi:uncharacterized protein
MDHRLLEILACPSCKKTLQYQEKEQELWCLSEKLVFTIQEGVPIMLLEKASPLPEGTLS